MSGRVAPEELQERTRQILAKEGSKAVCNRTQVSAATVLRVILGEPVSAGTIALLEKGLLEMDELGKIYKERPIGIGFPRPETPKAPPVVPIAPLHPVQQAAGFCKFVESIVRRTHSQKPVPWGVRPTELLIGDELGLEIWVGDEDERVTHDSAVTLALLAEPDDWKTDPNLERLARFICREVERLRGDNPQGEPPQLREQREYEDPATQLARAKALAAEQIEALQHAEPASTLVAQPVDSDRGAPGNSDGGWTRRVNEPSVDPEPDHEPEHANRREGDEPQAPRNSSARKRRR